VRTRITLGLWWRTMAVGGRLLVGHVANLACRFPRRGRLYSASVRDGVTGSLDRLERVLAAFGGQRERQTWPFEPERRRAALVHFLAASQSGFGHRRPFCDSGARWSRRRRPNPQARPSVRRSCSSFVGFLDLVYGHGLP
jgi:hypothetical protein